MVIFYKKWKKYNEMQLTNSKMDLNIRKMTNHPPFPGGKKKRTIQYGYRKCGTHALAHGNSKNETRQRDREGKQRGVSM